MGTKCTAESEIAPKVEEAVKRCIASFIHTIYYSFRVFVTHTAAQLLCLVELLLDKYDFYKNHSTLRHV
jgi:hypothetical protein